MSICYVLLWLSLLPMTLSVPFSGLKFVSAPHLLQAIQTYWWVVGLLFFLIVLIAAGCVHLWLEKQGSELPKPETMYFISPRKVRLPRNCWIQGKESIPAQETTPLMQVPSPAAVNPRLANWVQTSIIRKGSPLPSPSHYVNPSPVLKVINLTTMHLSGHEKVLLRRKRTLFLEKLLRRYSRSISPSKAVYAASIIRTILLTEADYSDQNDIGVAYPHETEAVQKPLPKLPDSHSYKITNLVIDVPEQPLRCISDSLPKHVSEAGGWKKTQTLKKKLASVSGRTSQHRLHLVQKSVGSVGTRQRLVDAGEESRVAVVNLTYQQRDAKKTEKRLEEVSWKPGKLAVTHFKASHRSRRRDLQFSDLAVTPSHRPVDETIEETEIPGPGFVTPRSTSCTPTHWEATTVSLPSKSRRRTVFTHKVSEVPRSCGDGIRLPIGL